MTSDSQAGWMLKTLLLILFMALALPWLVRLIYGWASYAEWVISW